MKTILYIKAFVCLLCILLVNNTFAQNVGITTSSSFTPDASAGLDVSFTNKGLLIPRVALTATNAVGPITSPATSLLVYNTATAGTSPNNVVPGYYYWNGAAWTMLTTSTQSANFWSTTGNAGTTYNTNFLGTTDNQSLRFRTNNTQRFLLDSLGNVAIGLSPTFSSNTEKLLVDAGTTSSFNVINGKGSINNYLQLNIQNTNAGTAASSDVVATADNGSETVNYIDMGINSSGNTAAFFGGINDSYLYNAGGTAAGGNLFIGTSTSGKALGFMTGGGATTNERMRIDGNGNVGIGTTTPTQKLDVKGTIVASATTYPNYAYNTANRMAFGESVVPPNETGSVVQFGSGSNSRNMLFAFSKTNINTSFFGNDGTQMMIGSEGTSNPITFKTGLTYNVANIIGSGREAMRITAASNVGIGTTTPATKLHVFGANPLTLSGVVTGTTTSTDSLLTITSGLVRKLPLSTFAIAANAWSTTGNAGTAYNVNFLGTTDNQSLRFRTNNTQRLLLDSLGNVAIGLAPVFTASPNAERLLVDAGSTSANPSASYNVINGKGYLDSYLQLNIQNMAPTASASSDIVATADNGSETANFIDMGINSSGNTSTGAIGGASTAYLYGTGNDMAIGNGTANKSLIFFTGGTSPSTYTERIRLDASGRVGIGTNSPASDLTINQSSGTGGGKGIRFTGNSLGGASSGTGFLFVLGFNSSNNKQIWFGDPDGASNSASTFLRIEAGTTGLPTLNAIAGDNSTRRTLALGNGGDANAGVMFGNDGSGTTPPSSFVWDNGNMAIGNGYRGNAAPSNGLIVQGNVGIGTTAPSSTLVAQASASNNGMLKLVSTTGNAGDQWWMGFGHSSVSTDANDRARMGVNIASNGAGRLFFTTGVANAQAERMRIDENGNVGIGITAPTAKLDVQGTVNLGVGGTTFNNIMRGSITLGNTTTISNTNKLEFTATITGVTTGANVILNPTTALPQALGIASVRVGAANTIIVAITNTSTTAIALGTVTFNYTVIQ